GGDRAQTVSALDRLIPALQQRGYRFETVSQAFGDRWANAPATAAQTWRGAALVWSIRIADGTLRLLWVLLIVAGALIFARTVVLLAVAIRHARRRRAPAWSWGSPVTEPISVIVPAFNEQITIGPAVRSLALSEHPDVEV